MRALAHHFIIDALGCQGYNTVYRMTKSITQLDNTPSILSLFRTGAEVLILLDDSKTVANLLMAFNKNNPRPHNLFFYTLYFLYIIGVIDYKDNKIYRRTLVQTHNK